MTGTAWALLPLVPLAIGMCVWAVKTGGPGPEWRHETHRSPAHSQRTRDQDTQRLTPPSAGWLPPRERPGGEAQRLPHPDDLPWPRERSH